MAIRAALEDRGDPRARVLVPDSAHGTNPASAALCGYTVDPVPSDARGRIDVAALNASWARTWPRSCSPTPTPAACSRTAFLKSPSWFTAAGAFFYCDGANFNALVGRVRPGDLGIDAMHINLHKTFSTPHGGGGPGAGPVALSEALAPYAPLPLIIHDGDGLRLVEHRAEAPAGTKPLGRIKAFHGQMGMFTRAYAYMLSHGADGLRQVAEDAVLNANYVLAQLGDVMSAPYPAPCMHEALFDDGFLDGTGVTTLDFAKAMIDEGLHPMTIYFPLIVHGAMLIEPTETESKRSLDGFIAAMRALAEAAKSGDTERFTEAPRLAPRRRLDEVRAARTPILRWRPPADREAAE